MLRDARRVAVDCAQPFGIDQVPQPATVVIDALGVRFWPVSDGRLATRTRRSDLQNCCHGLGNMASSNLSSCYSANAYGNVASSAGNRTS